ncbi:jg26452 [Pararge aegeria aegeria]|uniref:Jg26452 protein n=1 Tax=Pararge aegeria aegeria TaxID=348720 RepID=A0A8S4QZA8_9NEOP|nr:jg26452 [Pararge aegeria aegeria]
MGGAHSSENRWTLGVLRCWNGGPAPVNAALVGAQRGGQMTSGESLGAAGGKRLGTVYCGTPYKRPMSSSGRRLVGMMMVPCHDTGPAWWTTALPLLIVVGDPCSVVG